MTVVSVKHGLLASLVIAPVLLWSAKEAMLMRKGHVSLLPGFRNFEESFPALLTMKGNIAGKNQSEHQTQ